MGKAWKIWKVVAATLMLMSALATSARADEPVKVMNSASFQLAPVARGALLTIYTSTEVSSDVFQPYDPWDVKSRDGMRVLASCAHYDDLRPMRISFVGKAFGGNHINFYYPNKIGNEPWDKDCANDGLSQVLVYPANGGTPLRAEIMTLPAHPGIFMQGDSPAGDHMTPSGSRTVLAECRNDLPSCPVRQGGKPSELRLVLTGAEWFLCDDPCTRTDIIFELGPDPKAPDSSWKTLPIRSIVSKATGSEEALVKLRSDTAPGKQYLRVRNTFRKEFPDPLRVDFGQAT